MSCPRRDQEGERGNRFANNPNNIDFLPFSHALPGFCAIAWQLWVVLIAGGTGASPQCVCGVLQLWGFPVYVVRLGCHCTIPSDTVIG